MRGQLVESRYGNLLVWQPPVPGRQYAVGVDTSSGIGAHSRDGDPSAACVLDLHTCEQVAEWSAFENPTLWGFKVARLAWYYNTALLAIETHPSQHGLCCFDAAERYGYPALWMQQKQDVVTKLMSTRRGWSRHAGSTMQLYNRIRDALNEGCVIRSDALLDELSAIRLEDGKPKSNEHQDRVVAYGLGLMVRDQVWARGEIKEPEAVVEDLADAYWKRELGEGIPVGQSPFPNEEVWHGF